MKEIRMIASDMDGTLFNSEREISDRNAAAILAAQKKGVLFALCTGRISQFGALHVNFKGISCPVIGVPTSVGYGAAFGGLSALLAMLNSCASGISVVNIDNGFGAAVFALTIV